MSVINDFADGFSVIVCCYNSAQRLPETLYHLSKQRFNKSWEIIVVDNCSTDNTVQVAEELRHRYNIDTGFVISNAPVPGLNNARKIGVNVAKYRYVIFCDDDNWLNDNYLQIAYEMISSNPLIGAVGGQCVPETPSNNYPEWFDVYKNNYAIGKQAEASGDVTQRGYLWGAGLISTKSILNKCFDSRYPSMLTDRVGNVLSSGGDTEICCRIILCGYSLYYDERLVLKHFIPVDRLTLAYLDSLLAGINVAGAQLAKYYKVITAAKSTSSKKINAALKSFIKLLGSPVKKSWNARVEKQLLYVYSNIDLGVDDDVRIIKKFKNEFAQSAS